MKAYVINLERSPERLAHFAAQAERAGLAFERLAAVEGRALSAAERSRAVAARYMFQPLNPGEIGIFLSQRSAWQRLVDSGDAMAAVFEDDVVLCAQAGRLIARLAGLLAAPDQDFACDIVKLETTLRPVVLGPPGPALDTDHRLHPLCSWHGGAAGYVVTREAARRLLAATWPLADPVDQVLFNPMSPISAALRLWQLCPGLCVQKNILERGHAADGVFGTTIDRHRSRGRFLRHGLAVDLRRAWLKHKERMRRQQLARAPGHASRVVAFDAPAA